MVIWTFSLFIYFEIQKTISVDLIGTKGRKKVDIYKILYHEGHKALPQMSSINVRYLADIISGSV